MNRLFSPTGLTSQVLYKKHVFPLSKNKFKDFRLQLELTTKFVEVSKWDKMTASYLNLKVSLSVATFIGVL